MSPGKLMLHEGIAETTRTHLDRKQYRGQIKRGVHKRLGDPKMVVIIVLVLFTLNIALKQLLMLSGRHS